jgi:hypothetical protein
MGFAGWLALSEPTAGGDFHPAPKAMNRSVEVSVAHADTAVNWPRHKGVRPLADSLKTVIYYLAGWLVLAFAFVITQTRFYDAHQRAHQQWRKRSTPWLLSYSGRELRAMLLATFERNADPIVEGTRRFYLVVLATSVLYLVIGFPLAVWLLT